MVVSRITGFAELQAKLNALPDRLQKRVLSKAVRAAALVVRDTAKTLAPIRTGELRRDVVVRSSRKNRKTADVQFIVGVEHGAIRPVVDNRVTVKNKYGKLVKRRATAREKRGGDPFYFRFQELGFRAVGTRRRGQGRKIAGKRFLTNALPLAQDRAIAKMREVLAQGIQSGEATKS